MATNAEPADHLGQRGGQGPNRRGAAATSRYRCGRCDSSQILRLEDRTVSLARAAGTVTFPANYTLIAATETCFAVRGRTADETGPYKFGISTRPWHLDAEVKPVQGLTPQQQQLVDDFEKQRREGVEAEEQDTLREVDVVGESQLRSRLESESADPARIPPFRFAAGASLRK